ncbi:glycerophosphodiester phosphodiesterase [Ramlibacter sp.]|uniref:glycerophosphodiester phosphodiesterase n=1 Tax=Ramlibacter sp. TaxID=1917967 RepID=UPI003D13CD39
MYPRRRLAIALAFAATCTAALAQSPSAPPPQRAFDLQAHRGARALLPENSLPGFAYALGVGVTTLETDIAITKDNVLFLSHDPLLNPDITRGPDGKYLERKGPAIRSLTASDMARYDVGRIREGSAYGRTFANQKPVDGTRIPRLEELFALVKSANNDQVRFAIETKITPHAPGETASPEEYVRLILAAVRAAGMESRVSILSFDWRTLQIVQKVAPNIPTVYLTMQLPSSIDNIAAGKPEGSAWTAGFQLKDHGSVPKMIKAAGGHTWSCFWRDLSAEKVKEAQALGLQVLAWTVNDPAGMRQMMDWGVDGIVTDRPDLLRAEAEKRGFPLPKPTPVK